MMRKMLRTIGSAEASVLLNLSMIVSSVPFHCSVKAPRSRARGRQIQTGEAVKNRQRAAVDQRQEIFRRVADEVGKGHFTRQDESSRTREQAEQQQRAPDEFNE